MIDFFTKIFESEVFMPHGQCFLWYPEILWLHVISDVIITIAYFSIPITILYVVQKHPRFLPFKWIYVMFSSFIFLCGLTHLISIIVLWIPLYRLEGTVKAITAGVSIATAFLLIPIIPQILALLHQSDKKEIEPQGISE